MGEKSGRAFYRKRGWNFVLFNMIHSFESPTLIGSSGVWRGSESSRRPLPSSSFRFSDMILIKKAQNLATFKSMSFGDDGAASKTVGDGMGMTKNSDRSCSSPREMVA